ncbi:ATP-binding protein [Desulfoluna butyratoxydans]|uniref:Atpase aaa-type core n=1 Tax=Desulfoluna butyratoxydans TaxID=231438 RepID=A0A4U8YQ05_9BACT|nr:ATP-binding protein [Desulfoluna butyratoxydans]VFQ45329.1 atpase aaa-type core [Desulfoluna butyratoxydans]
MPPFPNESSSPAPESFTRALEQELAWFEQVLETRIALYFGHECRVRGIEAHVPPDLAGDASSFAEAVREMALDARERLVLVLALAPHIRPQVLDTFFIQNKTIDRGFTEFGGVTGNRHGGFLPTGETAAFIVAGGDLSARMDLLSLFGEGHSFARNGVLALEGREAGEPLWSRSLQVSEAFLHRITSGGVHRPEYGAGFPARRLTTPLTWDDLVLSAEVMEEIDHIVGWGRFGDEIMESWGLSRVLKPGYRALFHGPPGTGKTLTASLIGEACGVDVYRIDLSMMISKYIGETEKNLAGVFDQAEHRNWILFFDEADALFGKRTQASSSNDRHANQETAYLLQRIEDFPGVVILATNMKANLDEAFFRRFQSAIYFPVPDAEQRQKIWTRALHGVSRLSDDVDVAAMAEAHALTGGSIVNVIRFGAIQALREGRQRVGRRDFEKGIRKELLKEGKTG